MSTSRRRWTGDKVRDAVNAHLQTGRRDGRRARRARGAGQTSTRAFRRPADTISTASSTAARRRRWSASASGGCRGALDAEAMHEAAQRLLGRHDFTTFRSMQCQAESPRAHAGPARRDAQRRDRSRSARRRAPSCTTRCARWSGSLKRVGEGGWTRGRPRRRARSARPRRLRTGRAARRALPGRRRLSGGPEPARAAH